MTPPDSGVSEDVVQFITDHISSLHQLEVLLLLQRTAPQAWTAAQVAAELRHQPDACAQVLDDLAHRGLLRPDGVPPAHAYAPVTSELAALVAGLSVSYAERPVAVVRLIFSKPPPIIEPLRAFADAFRIRGKGEK